MFVSRYWSVLDKIGQDVTTIHDPVPFFRYESRFVWVWTCHRFTV